MYNLVVPECGGAPFWQIFLSQNDTPVNIVYHSRNAGKSARTISKFTLCTKFVKLNLDEVIEIVTTTHQMSYFKAKIQQIRLLLELRPRPRREAYSALTDP